MPQPRTPPEDKAVYTVTVRLTRADLEIVDDMAETTGLSRAQIFRTGGMGLVDAWRKGLALTAGQKGGDDAK